MFLFTNIYVIFRKGKWNERRQSNASIYYFGKSAKDLNLAEASILAGIPKSPSYYSPITNYNNAKMRQKIILNAMVNNKFINESEKEKAISEKLNIVGK